MAREQFHLGKVFFVPAFTSPFKRATRAAGSQRLAMVKLAIAGQPAFQVSAVELEQPGPSYTYETAIYFRKQFPAARLFFLLGEDAFSELDRWYRVAQLCRLVTFLVAPRSRENFCLPRGLKVKYRRISSPLIDISATLIRQRCRQGKSVRYLVPDSVYLYLKKERLYGLGKNS